MAEVHPRPAEASGVRADRQGLSDIAPVRPGSSSQETAPKARPAPPEDGLSAVADRLAATEADEALLLLGEWLAARPDHPDAEHGRVLQGVLQARKGQHAQAVRSLADLSAVPPTLSDLHGFTLGTSLLAEGQALEALPHFEAVARMHRSPYNPQAAFRTADALFALKRWKKAKRAYEQSLKTFPEYPERMLVRYRKARCDEALGKSRLAVRQYETLSRQARGGSEARRLSTEGLERLAAAGLRVKLRFDDKLAWAMRLRRKRQWGDALAVLEGLMAEARTRATRKEVAYQRARNLESLDRYQEALDALAVSRQNGGFSSDHMDAKIRLLRKLKKTEEAVTLVENRSGRSKKVRGLAAARVYIADGFYEKAYTLKKKYMRTKFNRDRQWQMAWLAYRSGRYTEAASGFESLNGKKGIRRHKAKYWQGRALMKAGETETARHLFTELWYADTLGYYGIQSVNRILDMGYDDLYRELSRSALSAIPEATERVATGASVAWDGADGNTRARTPLRKRQPELLKAAADQYGVAFPELHRAHDLYRMGLYEEARRELRTARAEFKRVKKGSAKRMANKAGSLYLDLKKHRRSLWGSRVGRKLGLHYKVKRAEVARIKVARKVRSEFRTVLTDLLIEVGDAYWGRKKMLKRQWRTVHAVPRDDNLHIQKLAYPLVHEDTLRKHANQQKVPLYLVTSIARVESGFNELAVSHAGARGMMQVMPVTGNLIAINSQDPEFGAAMLLEPLKALEYGTWYLDQLLTKFKDQEPLAIMSYNAGPHRTMQWLKHRGDKSEMDEFIEEVPYREARRYTKSVLRYMSIYRRIYDGRSDFYIGQIIDPTFKDNINW